MVCFIVNLPAALTKPELACNIDKYGIQFRNFNFVPYIIHSMEFDLERYSVFSVLSQVDFKYADQKS